MNNSMNFTLFNRIKPQPKQEETPSTPSWDAALEVSRDVEETVLLKEAPAAPESDGRPAPFPHVAVGAPEPRRMTVTTGETQETQPEPLSEEAIRAQLKENVALQLRRGSNLQGEELQAKIAAANEQLDQAVLQATKEVTPPKEDTVGWFTVVVSLFFGLSVFMFKHAAALVITFLTYVDPETEAKWVTK